MVLNISRTVPVYCPECWLKPVQAQRFLRAPLGTEPASKSLTFESCSAKPLWCLVVKTRVLATGGLDQLGPLPGKSWYWYEHRDGKAGIEIGVGFHALLDPCHAACRADRLPFPGPGQPRIESPVHEQAKPGFTSPLHTRIVLRGGRGGGHGRFVLRGRAVFGSGKSR